jgi:hypothetical protein
MTRKTRHFNLKQTPFPGINVFRSDDESNELLDKWILSLLASGGFEHQNESDQATGFWYKDVGITRQ